MFCNQGWQCPKCQKIWSPTTTGCNNCNQNSLGGGWGPATSGGLNPWNVTITPFIADDSMVKPMMPDESKIVPFVSGFQVVDPVTPKE